MTEIEEKLELVRKIVKSHPGYGTDKGYSWYQGGMRDTGDWYWEKLLDETKENLVNFLEYLKEEEIKVVKNAQERQRIANLPEIERNEIYKKEKEEALQNWKNLLEEEERQLMWGKIK